MLYLAGHLWTACIMQCSNLIVYDYIRKFLFQDTISCFIGVKIKIYKHWYCAKALPMINKGLVCLISAPRSLLWSEMPSSGSETNRYWHIHSITAGCEFPVDKWVVSTLMSHSDGHWIRLNRMWVNLTKLIGGGKVQECGTEAWLDAICWLVTNQLD